MRDLFPDDDNRGNWKAWSRRFFLDLDSRIDFGLYQAKTWGRELFGANGIVVDYNAARFFADAEALYSYEGTREINTLIVGRAITGLGAFV